MAELAEPDTGAVRARAILDRISKKQNGKLAAANTANRKRAVLNNIMKYAVVERKILPASPLDGITWTRPRTLKKVDPRCVVNAKQARRFLAAVGELGPRGARMVAFFGCMYATSASSWTRPGTPSSPARTGSPAGKTSPIGRRRRHRRPGRDQDSVSMICKP